MAHRVIALVTDSLTYETSYQPFERPPDNTTLYSLIPRGLRRFFLQTDTAVKPVNDQIVMLITATLPVNFAYLLRSFNYQLTVDTSSDWDNSLELRMFNHIPGQPLGTSESLQVQSANMATTAPMKFARADSIMLSNFAGPIWAVHGGGITFRVQATNQAAAVQAAGFVITHVEFLEYDLTQAQRYYVNTPVPVLTR